MRQRDADEVDGGSHGQHVEVPHRDDARVLPGYRHRVRLVRVQLDRKLRKGVADGISAGAEHLRNAAEAQRILQVARGTGIPQVTPLEGRSHAGERRSQPWVRP